MQVKDLYTMLLKFGSVLFFFLSRILFFIFIVTFAIPLQKYRQRRRKFTEPEVIAILLEISAGLRCFPSLDLSGDSFILCSFVSIYL